MDARRRVFVDIDGTLAKWTPVDTPEKLLEKGFYEKLQGNDTVINAVKILCRKYQDKVEVYTLSAYLEEHPCPVQEKNNWLDAMGLGLIDHHHRLFCKCSEEKKTAVPGGIRRTDILVDDYTKNLMEWDAKGVKLINGINCKTGKWKGRMVSMFSEPEEIAETILRFSSET